MKAVLFDLDGTILDRQKSLYHFVEWQAEEILGAEVSNREAFVNRFIELDQNGLVWKDKVYETLVEEFSITRVSITNLLNQYQLYFCSFVVPITGAIEALSTLKELGLLIGLVSNGKSDFQQRNFHALGISHLFDLVVISDDIGLKKPDTAIFEYATQRLIVDPKETIFIGDNVNADIIGANNAGMFSIFYNENETCVEADINLSNYADLGNIISNLS